MYYNVKKYNVVVNYIEANVGGNKKLVDNWEVVIYCKGRTLNESDTLVDYDTIENFIYNIVGSLDGLNSIVDFPPTLENMAKWICEQIVQCYKIEINTVNKLSVTYEEEII